MKVFVTGGTGFIGSHLVDHLLDLPDTEVRCLVRNDPKWLSEKPVKTIRGDLHDLPALTEGLKGVDVLFHGAALVKAPKKETFMNTNVDATENLLRIAQKAGVKNMVFLSSLAAVGPSFKKPVTEDDPMMPISMYGESKKKMEEMIHGLAKPGDQITILRPPAVYGPREEEILSFFKICNRGICPIIGNGKTTRVSMVHVADVVQALLLAMQHPKEGVRTYFVGSEDYYIWNRIMHAVSAALGKKLQPIYIKKGIVRNLGIITESLASLAGRYPMFNKEKALEMTHEWTCSIDKIKSELGYSETFTIESGIIDTIAWYKKHNWL